MKRRDEKRFAVALDTFSVLDQDKAMAALAEKYEPREGLSFIGFTYHATAPEVNMKAMAITPATMQASIHTVAHTMLDYEHRAEDLALPREEDADWRTEIMGHIAEVVMEDMPDAADADAWLYAPHIPKEPILTRGVMVLYTRIFKVQMIADEVERGTPWYFSLEIGEDVTEPAIWLKGDDKREHEIIPWSEASEDLRFIASQPKMMEYDGRAVAYLMGGAAGMINFVGGAITRNPAGLEQRAPGNSLMLVASADGVITDVRQTAGKWERAYINTLPDSSFVVVEGDYKSGKTEDKNARHLPIKDASGKIDLPQLKNALSVGNQIIAVSGSETSAELRTTANSRLEEFRKRLMTGKEGQKDASDDNGFAGNSHSGIIVPITIDTWEGTLEFYGLIDDMKKVASAGDDNNDTGGETTVAKIEIEEKDLNKRVADSRTEGKTEGFEEGKKEGLTEGANAVLEKAVADGTHIPAADVDGIVDKRLMSKGRISAIDELTCDDDTKADFKSVAANEERYPLDADGQTKFDEAFKRWEASMKTASDDDVVDVKDGDDGKKDDDKKKDEDAKKTASDKDEEDKKDLDMGSGGGGGGDDDPFDLKVEEV